MLKNSYKSLEGHDEYEPETFELPEPCRFCRNLAEIRTCPHCDGTGWWPKDKEWPKPHELPNDSFRTT